MVVSAKPAQELSRFQRWTNSAAEQWRGFRGFVYNPAEKTVLGRGAASWGRISIFYMCYYSFLAALFAISITIVLSTLDPNVPRFQTRLQGPGVSIQPRQESKKALSSDIIYKLSDASSYSKYITQMDDFLGIYRDQSNPAKYKDCNNSRINLDDIKEENRDKIRELSCRFDIEALGDCLNSGTEYGYRDGRPCILVKINRIVNWFPVGYIDISGIEQNSISKAPALKDVLEKRSQRYDPYLIYVACYGVDEEDQMNLNGETGVSTNTTYFPPAGGIPFKYYPYLGKRRNPNYLTPLVAVQFQRVRRDVEISVRCKAYARNIVDDDRMQIGYYSFKIKIES